MGKKRHMQTGEERPHEDIRPVLASIAQRSRRLVLDWLARAEQEGPVEALLAGHATDGLPLADMAPYMMRIGGAFLEMAARLAHDPARLAQAQLGFWRDYLVLWQQGARRMMGLPPQEDLPDVTLTGTGEEARKRDRRFRDPLWRENEVFDFIRQSYLLSARFIQDQIGQVGGMSPDAARKVDFYTRHFIDAMSPANFWLTNPQVLKRTIDTRGENLLRGLNNLLADLERGRGRLRIRMTDIEAFRTGETIATSPGFVVYRNTMMELIQYEPQTERVLRRPLLIVPPWINKFYILDLQPHNSFVRWATAQGHTVFVISWINPDETLAGKSFDDYMTEGVFAALDEIARLTGERKVNGIGYCLGGTLLGCSAGVLAARGDDRLASTSFLATMLDFCDPGEISVFIDEEQLRDMEARMNRRGYLDGTEMSETFNLLRANDLIWSFVVNHYLMGETPVPFDLLHWNSDGTRMPARMHIFYLRTMYRDNLLVVPNAVALAGTPIDLSRVTAPAYFLATREDHIAPWRTIYRGMQALGGERRFVLSGAGHVAGIVNPPGIGKYGYWVNDCLADEPEEWLADTTEIAGSWWTDWNHWVTALAPEKCDARHVRDHELGHAPGTYVNDGYIGQGRA
ncbi:Poly(3-hydroxyalkanoate) polymerase [Granulibacter bethesdensis CGDNIH4]|nr:Poly(3-hydroxyalkanoate) polymerase [Granulibacter bethesdensis CGDNIH4]